LKNVTSEEKYSIGILANGQETDDKTKTLNLVSLFLFFSNKYWNSSFKVSE